MSQAPHKSLTTVTVGLGDDSTLGLSTKMTAEQLEQLRKNRAAAGLGRFNKSH